MNMNDQKPTQPNPQSQNPTQPADQPLGQAQPTDQASYVDGYQPPTNPPSAQPNPSSAQPSSASPEPEVNPVEAEEALNQVLKQLDEAPLTPVDQTSSDQPANQPPTDQVVKQTSQTTHQDQTLQDQTPQNSDSDKATDQTTSREDEIAKAKQTLEEILKEIEAKRKANNLKADSQASMPSSPPQTQPQDQPQTQPELAVKPQTAKVTSDQARQAREELARILAEIEAESQKTLTQPEDSSADSKEAQPKTDEFGAVGAGQDLSTGTPAQPTAPPLHPQVEDQAQVGLESQPKDKDTALMDFEAEDDLPVATDEVKQVHDQVIKAETGQEVTPPPTKTEDSSSAKTQADLSTSTQTGPSEKLEDQNIFFMLGVNNAKEAEKEQFLDELQQVVWEDFLENDAKLLLTQEEYQKLKEMLQAKPNASFADQAEVVNYLNKLIPDLEEIMVEKAMELKAEMFKERLTDLKNHYQSDPAKLAKVKEAEALMNQGKWHSAANLLNQLS